MSAHFEFFARDSFRGRNGVLGGALVDLETPIAMRDKVQHLVGAFALAWFLAVLTSGLPRLLRAVLVAFGVFTAGLAVEAVEVARRYLWWRSTERFRFIGWRWDWDRGVWLLPPTTTVGQPPAPPSFLCDGFSWRDLVANTAGATPVVLAILGGRA